MMRQRRHGLTQTDMALTCGHPALMSRGLAPTAPTYRSRPCFGVVRVRDEGMSMKPAQFSGRFVLFVHGDGKEGP